MAQEQLQVKINELQRQLTEFQALLQTNTDNSATVKLPTFWRDEPVLWFEQAEAKFETAGITQDLNKYGYVLSTLDERVAKDVKELIASPPVENKFEHIKKKLIARYSISEEQQVQRQLNDVHLGDSKPSTVLQHLRSLSDSSTGVEGLIRELWMHRLPQEVQRILMMQRDLPLDKVAEIADTIFEAMQQMSELMKKMNEVLKKVSEFSRETRSSSESRSQRKASASGSDYEACWYHRCFGSKAVQCISPCEWLQQPGNDESIP